MTVRELPVTLHVGGTTTGGEDLVVFLSANRAGLRRAGLGLFCFDPAGTGPDSLAGLMAAEDAAGSIAARMAADRKVAQTGLVVSAADLAGPASDLMMGRFYPNVRQRARVLARALGQPVERLVLAVQPYTDIFFQTWLALAADRPLDPFADYVPAIAHFEGGWAEVASALVEELGVGELRIVAEPATPRAMLSTLQPGLVLRQPVQPFSKPKMTVTAAAMMQRCMAQGTRFQPGQRDRLIAFHARLSQPAAAAAYPSLVASDLHGRYAADLAILAEMAGMLAARQAPVLAAE